MKYRSPKLIREERDCEVLSFDEDQPPSLVMNFEQMTRLHHLCTEAKVALASLPPSDKTASIQKFCAFIEEITSVFGRGLAEWDVCRAQTPERKLAALEVLDAMQSLEKLNRNAEE